MVCGKGANAATSRLIFVIVQLAATRWLLKTRNPSFVLNVELDDNIQLRVAVPKKDFVT